MAALPAIFRLSNGSTQNSEDFAGIEVVKERAVVQQMAELALLSVSGYFAISKHEVAGAGELQVDPRRSQCPADVFENPAI